MISGPKSAKAAGVGHGRVTAEPSPRLGAEVSTTPWSVLVADDDQAIRAVLEILIGLDDELLWLPGVGDGAAAIAAAVVWMPDIVICDANMPGVGGVEAARTIRTTCPYSVVALFTADDYLSRNPPPDVDAAFDKSTVDVEVMLHLLKQLRRLRQDL